MEDARLFERRVRQISAALRGRQVAVARQLSLPASHFEIDPRLGARRRIERYLETAAKGKKNVKEMAKTVGIRQFGPTGRRQKLAGALVKLAETAGGELDEARVKSIRYIAAQLGRDNDASIGNNDKKDEKCDVK